MVLFVPLITSGTQLQLSWLVALKAKCLGLVLRQCFAFALMNMNKSPECRALNTHNVVHTAHYPKTPNRVQTHKVALYAYRFQLDINE